MSSSSSVSASKPDYRDLPLETQVAQLMMVGYAGNAPGAITRRFLEAGVGGLILFRDNLQNLPDTPALIDLLAGLKAAVPSHAPPPLLGIDQEGGQVERLPHTIFPTALTPRSVALSPNPAALAAQMYGGMAQWLAQVGFNLDFFPTLDVNFNRLNPIIGVRSFGDDPETVWSLAEIVLDAFQKAGLISVGKHFPGHGNGTVDSHLDLPTLQFTGEELRPFQQAIDAGLPAMLVAHGFYPALQTASEEQMLPSSASPAVIHGLLRERCGFAGVVITDDMCMGAITRHRGPVDAALAALRAGVDILLYKQSTEDEWAVYEAVLDAFRTGALPMARLHESLERIARLKAGLPRPSVSPPQAHELQADHVEALADCWASQGIGVLAGDPGMIPLPPDASLLLIHPERASLGNYAFDVPTSPELDALVRAAGFADVQSLTYRLDPDWTPDELLGELAGSAASVVVISFNPLRQPAQISLINASWERFPQARRILVSAGTPYDRDAVVFPDLHLSLCSYRPASMRALARLLRDGFPA